MLGCINSPVKSLVTDRLVEVDGTVVTFSEQERGEEEEEEVEEVVKVEVEEEGEEEVEEEVEEG